MGNFLQDAKQTAYLESLTVINGQPEKEVEFGIHRAIKWSLYAPNVNNNNHKSLNYIMIYNINGGN